jgi:hypothetical protein
MDRKFFKTTNLLVCCCTALALSYAGTAAAESYGRPAQEGKNKFSISTTPIYQFEAPLNNGNVSVYRQNTSVRWSREISADTEIGLNLGYDYADYNFSGNTTLAGGVKPWGTIHTFSLGNSYSINLSQEWKLLVTPSVSISREDGADWDNAFSYGGYAAAIYNISQDLSIGLGGGIYSNLGEVNYFPGVAVRWRITDRLLLANPFRPGLTGPAGLELSYRLDDGWDVGSGAAYRNNRFRLKDNSFTQNGIGQVTSIPAWVRLSKSLGKQFSLDMYSGAVFGGAMRIEDSNGSTLSSDHHKPAPFIALTVSGRF